MMAQAVGDLSALLRRSRWSEVVGNRRRSGRSGGNPEHQHRPPIEATIGLDAALKAADVRAVRVTPPPTETNFACAWLTGTLDACEAAAVAYAAAVVEVAGSPK